MKKRSRAKAETPAQALFDAMEGEASQDASPPSVTGSAAEALAESSASLAPIEAALAEAVFAREERAILSPDAPQDAPGSIQDDEPAEEEAGAGEEDESDLASNGNGAVTGETLAGTRPASSMKNRDSMNNVALVFLEDAMARRLAVAWEVCGGSEEDWFDAAGFTNKQYAEARRISRALRLNGVCRDGGVTDPLALQYIQAVIAKPLTAAAAKKKPT